MEKILSNTQILGFAIVVFCWSIFFKVNRDINHYCNVTIATIDQISLDSKYYRGDKSETISWKLKIFDAVGGAGRGGRVDIRVGWGRAESDERRDKIVPRLHPCPLGTWIAAPDWSDWANPGPWLAEGWELTGWHWPRQWEIDTRLIRSQDPAWAQRQTWLWS